jgi:hypothetical protein
MRECEDFSWIAQISFIAAESRQALALSRLSNAIRT